MELVHSESQILNHIDLLKAVGTSSFSVPINDMEELRQFRNWCLPHRDRFQANIEGVQVTTWPRCVGVETLLGGFLSLWSRCIPGLLY